MTLKAPTLALIASLTPLVLNDTALAQDTRAAERDCIDTVERDYRPRGSLRVVHSEWAQAGTQVIVEAGGQRWTCMADDEGDVWNVSGGGGSSSSSHHGYDDDDGGYGGGVTLYKDTEFRGTSETFHDDVSYLGNTRIGNDQASSIRVSGGCRATLFYDANFRGRSVEISRDESQLAHTAIGNDEASSMEVDCRGGSYDDDDDDGYGGGYGRSVTLYKDSEYRGTSFSLNRDSRYLGDTPIGNDELSSIRVPSGCRVWLYADSEFRGASVELDDDERYLGNTRIGNDNVSSIEVDCR